MYFIQFFPMFEELERIKKILCLDFLRLHASLMLFNMMSGRTQQKITNGATDY